MPAGSTNSDFVELVLACGSWQEAQAIADTLLGKHLVACVEFLEIKSKYHRQGALREADEIKLVMEAAAMNFEKIEAEIKKLHSYDTFVLQQIPIERVSKRAETWWLEETNTKD
ncbi:MAG TPA: divalent cation tolerance protein CutA [Candidatus Saccharimonadales bacterium]|nr:divalent cation tolerance protein CutA [Candidatus Saccharimonadales bacterium]